VTPGSFEDAARILADTGWVGWQIVVMGAIGYAESALNPHAVHLVDGNPLSPWYLSLDLGWLQVNDAANGALLVSKGVLTPLRAASQQLLDPLTCAKAARAVFESRGGPRDPIAGYNAWTTFKSGAYAPFKAPALRAARAVGVAV
jgi:hypothetical protein